MKRLVGLFMLTTLLILPLGSLATKAEGAESNVVWSWSAEPDEPASSNGTIFDGTEHSVIKATDEGVTAPDGEYIFKKVGTKNGHWVYAFPTNMPSVQAGKLYKLSFWWYEKEGGYAQPKITIGLGSTTYTCAGAFAENNGYTRNQWLYFETYLIAPDTLAEGTKLNLNILSLKDETVFYDNFKLEEYEDSAVGFITGSMKKTSNSYAISKCTPQTGRAVTDAGNVPVHFYPVLVGGINKVDAFSDLKNAATVNVLTAYAPKSIDEKTALIVAVFGKNGDTDTLKDVIIETQEYKATADNATTPTYYYYGENMIKSLPVNISGYGECTLKAFMWSSVSGLKPLGESAVLGA